MAAFSPRPWPEPAIATAFTGCDCRGAISSERTLSMTSTWDPSTLEPSVAELQEANSPSDVRRKAAQTLRRIVGYRPRMPTRTIMLAIIDCVVIHRSLMTIHPCQQVITDVT